MRLCGVQELWLFPHAATLAATTTTISFHISLYAFNNLYPLLESRRITRNPYLPSPSYSSLHLSLHHGVLEKVFEFHLDSRFSDTSVLAAAHRLVLEAETCQDCHCIQFSTL